MEKNKKKKTVVVTGSSGLVGNNLIKNLIANNWHVIAVDITPPKNKLESVDYINFNLADIHKYDELVNKIKQKTKYLKGLINNAGINAAVEKNLNSFVQFERMELSSWDYHFKINLSAPVFLIKSLLPIFDHSDLEPCKVINVTSMYGVVAPNNNLYTEEISGRKLKNYKPIAYPVTKAALDMATRYLAIYLADRNFNVNALAPGGIQNNTPLSFQEKYNSMSPINRMAEVSEMMDAFLFLMGRGSNYMCGHTLVIDGGWTIW